MLTRAHFPGAVWRRTATAVALAAGLGLASAPARAESIVLHGPHPFLKDNEVSAHFLLTGGIGDSWSGNKIALDYGYRLGGPLATWLNLQLAWQAGVCARFSDACARNGDVFEALAGGKWKLATSTPLVPYAKAGAGLIFLFPDQARGAAGVALRGGGGVNYFLFDWLGFGVEAGVSVGHAFFDSSYTGSHTYAVIDLGAGVEAQF